VKRLSSCLERGAANWSGAPPAAGLSRDNPLVPAGRVDPNDFCRN
jgi:hypothetical protein